VSRSDPEARLSPAATQPDNADPDTRAYIERRMKDGKTKKEAFRCLKRYLAREVYNCLPHQQLALDNP
jgi:hypothetical protein